MKLRLSFSSQRLEKDKATIIVDQPFDPKGERMRS